MAHAALAVQVSTFLAVLGCAVPAPAQLPPSWEQLDSRPLPAWFEGARFGIFIHWGVYSVPAFCDTSTYSEWYQHWLDTNSHGGLVREFHERVYGSDFAYRDFAPRFRCELWDPAEWASIFKRAGADYIVVTSKHHDGFCLWPDAHSERVRGYPWNAAATGPRRDLLGELAAAVRAEGMRFGLYYSFLEWHNPLYERSIPDYVEQQMIPQIQDLIRRYEPAVFWPDGEWQHEAATWRSREIVQWLRDNAPNRDELVVNDRWGKGCRGEHGDYYTTEYGNYGGSKTHLGIKPFEECRGIGHSFAFNRLEGYDVYLSRTECVRTLIDLVSRGGKLLLDIGPDDDGTIPLIMVDRLLAIGRWLDENGAAIRGCGPSPFRVTPWGRATTNGDTVYLHVYDWPADGWLSVPGLGGAVRRAWLLREAVGGALPLRRDDRGVLQIDLRGHLPSDHATVVAVQVDGALVVDRRFLPDAEGRISLPATAATVAGQRLRLEPEGNLGYWTEPDDRASWPAVAVAPGQRYRVLLDYAVAPGAEGGELALLVGGEELRFRFARATGGWQQYDVGEAGSFATGDDQRQVDIAVRAVAIPGQALCNLRSVTLVPAGLAADERGVVWPEELMVRAALAERCRQLCQSLRDGDLAAVAAAYTDDAVLLPVGGAPVQGRAAIDAWWQALAGSAEDWQLETYDVRVSGGVVHQLGRSTLVTRRDGRRRESVVEFALTWQRADDGTLRIVSDVYWPPR